jgi:hypothetical protein
MGMIVIACYKPKPGGEEGLMAAVRDHMPVLRGEGLVTERAPIVMRAKDGTVVEVFEWVSAEAVDRAHHNAAVQALWQRFEAVCTYQVPAQVEEFGQMFPNFEAV